MNTYTISRLFFGSYSSAALDQFWSKAGSKGGEVDRFRDKARGAGWSVGRSAGWSCCLCWVCVGGLAGSCPALVLFVTGACLIRDRRLSFSFPRWRTLGLVRALARSRTHAPTRSHTHAPTRSRLPRSPTHPRGRACRALAQAKPTHARYIHSRHALTYAQVSGSGEEGFW